MSKIVTSGIRTIRIVIVAGFLGVAAALPIQLHAQVAVGVGVTIGSPPPPFPVYEQPPVPGPGYIWQPGYWAWGPAGYYWVPGAWIFPPAPGLWWTPGYWGWTDIGYTWFPGYWGPVVGFYGGVNYGFGYFGHGYVGGRWHGGQFYYNTAVTNVNTNLVHSVYADRSVIGGHGPVSVSYSGGRGGVIAHPTTAQISARQGHEDGHAPMTSEQMQHEQFMGQDRRQFAVPSHNQPKQVVVPRPFTTTNRPPTPEQIHPEDRAAVRGAVVRPAGGGAPHGGEQPRGGGGGGHPPNR